VYPSDFCEILFIRATHSDLARAPKRRLDTDNDGRSVMPLLKRHHPTASASADVPSSSRTPSTLSLSLSLSMSEALALGGGGGGGDAVVPPAPISVLLR